MIPQTDKGRNSLLGMTLLYDLISLVILFWIRRFLVKHDLIMVHDNLVLNACDILRYYTPYFLNK